jgi:hypothetical protein
MYADYLPSLPFHHPFYTTAPLRPPPTPDKKSYFDIWSASKHNKISPNHAVWMENGKFSFTPASSFAFKLFGLKTVALAFEYGAFVGVVCGFGGGFMLARAYDSDELSRTEKVKKWFGSVVCFRFLIHWWLWC